MADIQLDDINRSRLKGIVQKAVDNGESDSTIKEIVSKYKLKYGADRTGGFVKDSTGQPIMSGGHSMSTKNRQSMGGHGPDKPESEIFRDSVGKMLPSLVATAGSAITKNPALGGAAGSFVGEGLRQVSPDLFGGEESGSLTEDLGMNTLLPGLLGAVNKFAAGPRQYAADKLSSWMGKKLPAVKNLMSAEESFTAGAKASHQSAERQAEQKFRSKVFGENNPMVYDRNVKTPSGFTPSNFNAPEPNIEEVKKILTMVSDKSGKDNIARYTKRGLMFSLPAFAATRVIGAGPTAAIGGSIFLGDLATKQLVKDPEIAQLLIKAIKTPGGSQESGIISQTLLNALRGSAVMIKTADGEEQQAKIDENGRLVYPRR